MVPVFHAFRKKHKMNACLNLLYRVLSTAAQNRQTFTYLYLIGDRDCDLELLMFT